MKSAWPVPAGHQSTRQWLRRSDIVLPPSGLRRMKEFSPVITTSLGSTGVVMVVLLCARGHSEAPQEGSAGGQRRQLTRLDRVPRAVTPRRLGPRGRFEDPGGTGHAGAAEPAIPAGGLRQVLLVIRLGVVELRRVDD